MENYELLFAVKLFRRLKFSMLYWFNLTASVYGGVINLRPNVHRSSLTFAKERDGEQEILHTESSGKI